MQGVSLCERDALCDASHHFHHCSHSNLEESPRCLSTTFMPLQSGSFRFNCHSSGDSRSARHCAPAPASPCSRCNKAHYSQQKTVLPWSSIQTDSPTSGLGPSEFTGCWTRCNVSVLVIHIQALQLDTHHRHPSRQPELQHCVSATHMDPSVQNDSLNPCARARHPQARICDTTI